MTKQNQTQIFVFGALGHKNFSWLFVGVGVQWLFNLPQNTMQDLLNRLTQPYQIVYKTEAGEEIVLLRPPTQTMLQAAATIKTLIEKIQGLERSLQSEPSR